MTSTEGELNSAINKSIKGVGMLVVLKLALKVSQVFLSFAVVRAVDPTTYGNDLV